VRVKKPEELGYVTGAAVTDPVALAEVLTGDRPLLGVVESGRQIPKGSGVERLVEPGRAVRESSRVPFLATEWLRKLAQGVLLADDAQAAGSEIPLTRGDDPKRA
jgi:hypothetical protein